MAEEVIPDNLDITDELIAERRTEEPGQTPEDMTPWQRPITAFIDVMNLWVGRIICLLLIPLIFGTVFEVASRQAFSVLTNYGFNDVAVAWRLGPTLWNYDVSRMLGGVIFMATAGYAVVFISVQIFSIALGRPKPRQPWMLHFICCSIFRPCCSSSGQRWTTPLMRLTSGTVLCLPDGNGQGTQLGRRSLALHAQQWLLVPFSCSCRDYLNCFGLFTKWARNANKNLSAFCRSTLFCWRSFFPVFFIQKACRLTIGSCLHSAVVSDLKNRPLVY